MLSYSRGSFGLTKCDKCVLPFLQNITWELCRIWGDDDDGGDDCKIYYPNITFTIHISLHQHWLTQYLKQVLWIYSYQFLLDHPLESWSPWLSDETLCHCSNLVWPVQQNFYKFLVHVSSIAPQQWCPFCKTQAEEDSKHIWYITLIQWHRGEKPQECVFILQSINFIRFVF